jgi:hypothetical protein
MEYTLSYFPGQTAVLWLETLDGYGERVNSPSLPTVTRVIFPSFTLATGYPQEMVQFDIGLYYTTFVVPCGGASVGNYLVDVVYIAPVSDGYFLNTAIYQLVVQAPFGNFSTTVVG